MVSTEVLRAPFKQGSKPQELLRVADDLPAVGKVFWGYVSGNTNTLRAFMDWDSVEAHEAFHDSDAFPPFINDFNSIVAGEPSLWHVDFKPSLEALHKAQSAPVTAVVTFYLSGRPSAAFLDTASGFTNVLAQQPGFVEVALGVTHEEITFEGVKGHAMVILVGWRTEQEWLMFVNSEDYKENKPSESLGKSVLHKFEMEVVRLQPREVLR